MTCRIFGTEFSFNHLKISRLQNLANAIAGRQNASKFCIAEVAKPLSLKVPKGSRSIPKEIKDVTESKKKKVPNNTPVLIPGDSLKAFMIADFSDIEFLPPENKVST